MHSHAESTCLGHGKALGNCSYHLGFSHCGGESAYFPSTRAEGSLLLNILREVVNGGGIGEQRGLWRGLLGEGPPRS